MASKKHGKQNRKKVWNLQKAFSLCTIKVCRFEIVDGVKYVYCIKHAYKFLLREQVGFAAVLWHLRQCVSCIFWSITRTQNRFWSRPISLVSFSDKFGQTSIKINNYSGTYHMFYISNITSKQNVHLKHDAW